MTNTLLNTFTEEEILFTIILTDEIIEHGDSILVESEFNETRLDFDSDEELIDILTDEEFRFTFINEKLAHLRTC